MLCFFNLVPLIISKLGIIKKELRYLPNISKKETFTPNNIESNVIPMIEYNNVSKEVAVTLEPHKVRNSTCLQETKDLLDYKKS